MDFSDQILTLFPLKIEDYKWLHLVEVLSRLWCWWTGLFFNKDVCERSLCVTAWLFECFVACDDSLLELLIFLFLRRNCYNTVKVQNAIIYIWGFLFMWVSVVVKWCFMWWSDDKTKCISSFGIDFDKSRYDDVILATYLIHIECCWLMIMLSLRPETLN